MLRKLLTAIAFLSLAGITQAQESLVDRLDRMQKDQNAFMARQARMESDIADMRVDIKEVKDMVKAMTKSQGRGVKVSTDWAGDPVFTTAGQQAAPMISSYGSVGASAGTRQGVLPRLLNGKLRGGKCAGGG